MHKIEVLISERKSEETKVSFEHTSKDLMIADPLTKGLPPKTFVGLVERMNII